MIDLGKRLEHADVEKNHAEAWMKFPIALRPYFVFFDDDGLCARDNEEGSF